MKIAKLLVASALALAIALAGGLAAGAQTATAAAPQPAAAPEIHGIDPANLDTQVKPCEDFYKFATGGWVAKHPIPPEQSRWGSFDELALRNQQNLKAVLDAAAQVAATPKPASETPEQAVERKLGTFYAAAMDEKQAEELGAKPLAPYLQAVAAIKDLDGLAAEAGRLNRAGARAFVSAGSQQDAKDASRVIASVFQGGLGLPDRDYYLKDDAKSKAIRDAYVVYMTKLFQLVGDTPEAAAANAQTVLRLETAMAKASMSRIERRNPKATYHPMSPDELKALAPNFAWAAYFDDLGMPKVTTLNAGMPDYFKALSDQLKSEPLADWKTYLRWHVTRAFAPCLSSAFVKAQFDFSQVMTGAKEDLPRWRKAVSATNGALGEDLGQIYVKKYFPPEAKAQVLDVLHNVKAALRDDLKTLSWMSEPTRQAALAKLDKIEEKMGYPDKWRDYAGLVVERTSYLGNVVRSNEFETKRDLDKIGKPVDRTEWGMTPATVNAYYSAAMNEIVFPAGILQPPFFDPKADAAVNYGGIGVVIGHEITHGFDDKGSQYDAQGNLKDWWTPEDAQAFKTKGDKIVQQASAYVVDGDVHQQGELVKGEAIADLGGVAIAFRAYQLSLQGKQAPAPIAGFTGDQRFFLSFATVWAQSIRPEMARMLATIDSHPAAPYRVNATLEDFPPFGKAFACEAPSRYANLEAATRQVW